MTSTLGMQMEESEEKIIDPYKNRLTVEEKLRATRARISEQFHRASLSGVEQEEGADNK